MLARLFPDGSVDATFTNGATGGGNPLINCLAFQTNGQILVGGCFTRLNIYGGCWNLGRLNSDGTLDANFDAGYANTYCSSVNCLVIQPDNKILVGGKSTTTNPAKFSGLYRLNETGSLDTNFNALANGSVGSIALQPDGKILVEGGFTSIGNQSLTNLARLNPDGSVDASFQPPVFTFGRTTGITILGGGVVLIQPDGKILVGGLYDKVNGLAHTNIVRLNADGSLDSTFNAQADLFDCWGVQTLMLQADGKIIIGDDSYTLNGRPCPFLGRLNSNGSTDASFNTNLVVGSMVYSAVLQADGKILSGGGLAKLGGQARSYLGRLNNTGPATQALAYDGTNISWWRGGTSPEVWRTTFESSTDAVNWSYLGDGVRISGGWQLTNVVMSTNTNLRARGFVAGGRSNGSFWFVESMYPQAAPQFVTGDGKLGCCTNQFGCSVGGTEGSTVVIDASSDFLNWTPVATNLLYSAPLYFSDPSSTSFPRKFYRVRLP